MDAKHSFSSTQQSNVLTSESQNLPQAVRIQLYAFYHQRLSVCETLSVVNTSAKQSHPGSSYSALMFFSLWTSIQSIIILRSPNWNLQKDFYHRTCSDCLKNRCGILTLWFLTCAWISKWTFFIQFVRAQVAPESDQIAFVKS